MSLRALILTCILLTQAQAALAQASSTGVVHDQLLHVMDIPQDKLPRSLPPSVKVSFGYQYDDARVFGVPVWEWGGSLCVYSNVGSGRQALTGKNLEHAEKDFGALLPKVGAWHRYHLVNVVTVVVGLMVVAIAGTLVLKRLRGMVSANLTRPSAWSEPVGAAPGASAEAAAPEGLGLRSMSDCYASDGGVAIIALSDAPRDVKEVAGIIAQVTGVSPVDAAQHARGHSGVLMARKFDPDVAALLAESFNQHGLACLVQTLHAASPMGRVWSVELRADVLRVTIDAAGTSLDVPWSSIHLLSLALVGSVKSGAALEENLVGSLFCTEGQLVLPAKSLSFKHLGERMQGSGPANFALVLSDIHERAPQAILTPGVTAFLEHNPKQIPAFDTQAGFDEDSLARLARKGSV